MSTKHTNGNFIVRKHATPDYAPQFGVGVESNRLDIGIFQGPNAEADAHLFAAAPETAAKLEHAEALIKTMRQALENALPHIEAARRNTPKGRQEEDARADAMIVRAALAKASA